MCEKQGWHIEFDMYTQDVIDISVRYKAFSRYDSCYQTDPR